MRLVKIAMIQLKNHYEDQASGYSAASSIITQAAAQGAELAVLPELSGCGYIPNQSIWQFAEPADGKTAQWACELSAKLGIYIGAGFIETDGKDFYNSYLLSSPNGRICGIIRKEDAESYCFKRSKGDIYIDTDIGRIGIGICADNHYVERLNRMKDANIDFMLMPHASPAPYKTSARISERDVVLFEQQPYLVAATYSKYLRVPTVYVNAVGSFPKFMGGFGVKSFNESFRLMGGSLITNAGGEIIARMGSKEGYEICTITFGTTSGAPVMPSVYHGKWLHPGNTLYRYLIMPMLIRKGIRSYNKEHVLYMKTSQKG
ncbi:MAG: Nitrilase/cyanide hydratase and apolipoprotein N-acyltransferase [Firmicutes bacterium]|nr:Nitrilase/cyanide hydratase and apolipoprotein N-acyltransferase [Bacillota bacterium]